MSVASLWVAIRTTGAAQLGALRSRIAGLSRTWFAHTRTVSTVAGAYRDANGLWRNANGTLVIQRNHLRQTTTAWGHLANAASSAGDAMRNGLKKIGPEVAAAAAALGVVIAPAIGAAISAGILLALGGGVMGAGIALAIKQSEALQGAFGKTFGKMADQTKLWATGFEDELIGVTTRFGKAWDKISGNLGKAFEKAQEYVEPFAEGISQLVEKMFGGGGFNEAIEAAEPIIQEFSYGLSKLGEAFNSFFESLADGGEGELKGMIVLMAVLSGGIAGLGNLLEFLSKAFDVVTDAAGAYSDVMAKMLGWIPGVGDGWKWLSETLGLFNDRASKTREIIPLVGAATDDTNKNMFRSAEAAEKAAKAIHRLSEQMEDLLNKNLSVDQAQIAFAASLDALTKSVQENGRQLSLTTEAGRANREAILGVVESAEAARQAAIELAGGEKASESAVRAANQAFQAQIAQLEATMRKMGFTQQQIDAVLGKYRELANMPNITKYATVVTRFRTEGSPNYNRAPGNQVAFAKGTPSAPPGWAWVGEEGPELVRFRGGEQVMPTGESYAMAKAKGMGAAGGSGGESSAGVLVVRGDDSAGASYFKQLVRTGAITLATASGSAVRVR